MINKPKRSGKPGEPQMHVSHETIYLTLFVQARGGLKRELVQHLRTRRANRRPKERNLYRGRDGSSTQ